MKFEITGIFARQILDSRGNPTVEARVTLEDEVVGIASVPSGASTGVHEAHELRDHDKSRYGGKGVLNAVANVNDKIRPALLGLDAREIERIDQIMIDIDGTKSKSALGANAILAVSLAVARAVSEAEEMELYEYIGRNFKMGHPTPMFNLLNGGAHASNNVDIQEFMIVPHGLSLHDGIRAGSEIYHTLGRILQRQGLSTAVGDEGGYAPNLASDEEAIKLLCLAIESSGYSTDKIGIALDVASSEWVRGNDYILPKRGATFTSDELIDYYAELCKKYPIISIEDGLGEDDFEGWKRLTERLGRKIMLVGDDLFVTNEERLNYGITEGIGNAILIKPNQIGSLSETLRVISLAESKGYHYIISHRSGDTPDTAIADIAVGTGAGFIKTGAPCRGERVAKYNRLTEICR